VVLIRPTPTSISAIFKSLTPIFALAGIYHHYISKKTVNKTGERKTSPKINPKQKKKKFFFFIKPLISPDNNILFKTIFNISIFSQVILMDNLNSSPFSKKILNFFSFCWIQFCQRIHHNRHLYA